MERKDIIHKLMREGMSSKTLVNLNDRQLSMLAQRMLGEQASKPVLNIPKEKVADVQQAKQEKKQFVTYENESKSLKGNQIKLDKNKNGKLDAQDFKMLRNKSAHKEDVNEKKKPSAGLSAKKKSVVAKSARAGKDIGKPGKGFKEVEKKAKESGAKDPKAVAAAAMWKNLPREGKLKEDKEVQNWLMKLVENEYHPLTSKKEIMELIQSKMKNRLYEFRMNSPEIAEPDVDVEPDVDAPAKPSKPLKPRPRNPEDPFPGPDPDIKNNFSKMPIFLKYDALKNAGQPEIAEPDVDVEPDVDAPAKPSKPLKPRPRNPEDPFPGPDPDIKNRYRYN